jgi:hypothetical protein
MKNQRVVILLTILNVGLVLMQFLRTPTVTAKDDESMLRGRGLQIVDEKGRVRASISILKPDAKSHHETVILRLIDTNGRPNVKLAESSVSSGLALGGETDDTYIVLHSDSAESFVKLTNKAGRKQVMTP